MASKEELRDAFIGGLPAPSRISAIEMVRAYGFTYRKGTERISIYKHPELPDIPITIPSNGEKLNPEMAGQILSSIRMLDDEDTRPERRHDR